MLKRSLTKLILALALVLKLLGGMASSARTSSAHVAPAQHLQACGADKLPPCD